MNNGYVFMQIFVFLVILAAAFVTYAMVVSSRQKDVSSWVAESVNNWRSDELDVEHYDVTMKDASVGEIFHAFEATGPAYYTPEAVEDQWSRMVAAEQTAVSQLKSRFVKADKPEQPQAKTA